MIDDDEAFVTRAAGGGRRRRRAWRGVLLSRPFPHQLRDRHREPARGVHAHPALLPGPALSDTRPFLAVAPRPRAARPPRSQMTVKARAMRAAGHQRDLARDRRARFRHARAHAIEAGYQAALRGETKYPPQDGTPALKQAIQRKFKRDNGLDYALDEIMVANGGKQVIFNALMATRRRGRRGHHPGAVLGRLRADDEAARRRAGARSPARRTTASSCAPRISTRRSRRGPNG